MALGRVLDREQELASFFASETEALALADGSRVGVIGGGPAGSFFAYALEVNLEDYH